MSRMEYDFVIGLVMLVALFIVASMIGPGSKKWAFVGLWITALSLLVVFMKLTY